MVGGSGELEALVGEEVQDRAARQRIGGQDDGGGCPRRLLLRVQGSVVVVGAGPVGGVVAAQVLGPFNQPAGLVKIADSSQRQGQLAGLGGGHPGAIGGRAGRPCPEER